MIAFARWLFWNLAYALQPLPRDLHGMLHRWDRTRWPWRTFRPYVYHNNDGKQWEIYFTDECDYVERRQLTVEAGVGQNTGKIVSLTIWDSELERTEHYSSR